jgi:hypothetical protein
MMGCFMLLRWLGLPKEPQVGKRQITHCKSADHASDGHTIANNGVTGYW